jgi:hypothetical protein
MSASFFLRPAFDLPLASDGIGDAVVSLGEDQNNGPAPRSVTVKRQVVVLPDTRLDLLLCRADIIGAVGTSKQVDRHLELHGADIQQIDAANQSVRPSRLAL